MSDTLAALKSARIKNSKAGVFGEAQIIKRDRAITSSPEINIACNGDALEGGVEPGITCLVGDSRTFKTHFILLAGAAWQKKYDDAIFVFFDCENAVEDSHLDNADVDKSRFWHIPVDHVEDLHLEMMSILTNLDFKKQNIFIGLDSLGNLGSVEEVTAGENGVLKADAGRRAKACTSFFRSITPKIKNNGLPFWFINHAYDGIGGYGFNLNIGGGKKAVLSPDVIWHITRSQIKEDGDVAGWSFNIKIEKSRYIKDKCRIPVQVTFKDGVKVGSGLLDIAIELQYAAKPKNGWFCLVDRETGELQAPNFRRAATENMEFWNPVFENTDFNEAIKKHYQLDSKPLLQARELSDEEE